MMKQVNEDPLLDIRQAVSKTLVELQVSVIHKTHKEIVDAVVDRLPGFFRQTLHGTVAAELNTDAQALVVLMRDIRNHLEENESHLPSWPETSRYIDVKVAKVVRHARYFEFEHYTPQGRD